MQSRIELDDGKYTVCHEDGANLRALRYGEPWRDCCGDGLILALAQEVERLQIEQLETASLMDLHRELSHDHATLLLRVSRLELEKLQRENDSGTAVFRHTGTGALTTSDLNKRPQTQGE